MLKLAKIGGIVWVFVWFLSLLLSGGCIKADGMTMTPEQAAAIEIIHQTVSPVISDMLKNGVKASAYQGALQGQEPGYAADIEGYVVTGFKGRVTLYLKGVSGQMALSVIGEGTPASQPTAPPPSPSPTGENEEPTIIPAP